MARRPVARIVLLCGLLVATTLAVLAVVLPRVVRARVVAAAAAEGVALGIDDVSLAPGRARLRGVHASPLAQAGAKTFAVSADVVDVTLDGLTPAGVTVRGAHVALDGSIDAVRAALTPRGAAAKGTSSLRRLTFEDSSLTWKNVLPTPRIVVDAEHLRGDLAPQPGAPSRWKWHVETPELRLFATTTARAWSASADRDDKGVRVSVLLPKGAHVAVAVGDDGTRSLDVDTPEILPADIGVPSVVLGLVGDGTSHFELHLHHRQTDPSHAAGTLVLTAQDIYLGPATQRTSFALDARYAGDPRSSFAVSQGTLRAGPFTGALTGTFAVDPSAGVRAKLQYASGVMSCADAVKAQAASYGDLGKGVAALAGMLGLDRAVDGRISLRGEVDIAPGAPSRVSFHTEGDCRLSYLPSM